MTLFSALLFDVVCTFLRALRRDGPLRELKSGGRSRAVDCMTVRSLQCALSICTVVQIRPAVRRPQANGRGLPANRCK